MKQTKIVPPLNKGSTIAKLLWPTLSLEPPGSFWDKYGIDGYLNGNTVQIKFDGRIATSGNIYHEIYEKSALMPEQPWRKSPGIATHYIFVTEGKKLYIGYLISVDLLAKCEAGRKLVSIFPNDGACTSLGFLISLERIRHLIEIKQKGILVNA